MRKIFKYLSDFLENRELLSDFLPEGFLYKELEDAFSVNGQKIHVSVFKDSVIINSVNPEIAKAAFSWTWLPKYKTLYIDLFYPQNQSQKLPAMMFKKQLPVLRKLDIQEIRLNALKDGRYVWATYGFNSNEKNDIFSHLKRLYAPEEKVVMIPHMDYIAMYFVKESELERLQDTSYVKKTISRSDLDSSIYRDSQGNFRLGKYYLLHDAPNWDGRLKLWSGLDYQILSRKLAQ